MINHRAVVAGIVAMLLVLVAGMGAYAQPGDAIPVPDALRKAGVVRFGADFTQPPGTFLDANHHMSGVDFALCNEIGRRLGLRVEWTNLQFSGLIPALDAGRFDVICSSMLITPQRAQAVDFVPYRLTAQGAAVVKGNPHNVRDLPDVCGLHAAELLGSVYERVIKAQSQDCIAHGKAPIDLKTFPTVADAYTQLIDGRADVVMGDEPIVTYYVTQRGGGRIEIAFGGKNPTFTGLAIPPANSALAGPLTVALYAMKGDGTYAKIMGQWHLESGAIQFF
ncbi:MAG TPA: ABC transporter substrate-binding protein [bacterium]|nr:ABC transporter substrate-binding protein [bacterium]